MNFISGFCIFATENREDLLYRVNSNRNVIEQYRLPSCDHQSLIAISDELLVYKDIKNVYLLKCLNGGDLEVRQLFKSEHKYLTKQSMQVVSKSANEFELFSLITKIVELSNDRVN